MKTKTKVKAGPAISPQPEPPANLVGINPQPEPPGSIFIVLGSRRG